MGKMRVMLKCSSASDRLAKGWYGNEFIKIIGPLVLVLENTGKRISTFFF